MRYIIISLLFLIQLSLLANTKKVKVEYTYMPPENISLEEAKSRAVERAQIQAIADEFGTSIMQTNQTVLSNANGKSDNKFYSFGESEVNGEWIETTKEPSFEISYEGGMLIINVVIEGKIRKTERVRVDYELKILRNGTSEQFENDEFKSGDDLYVTFKSPIAGYLAIYLLGEDDQAYCILPYSGQSNGIYSITPNHRHILFSAKDATKDIPKELIEELYITCEKTMEVNQIFVLFSPNKFTKCNDEDIEVQSDGKIFPRHLDVKNFHKWLAECRQKDKDLIVDKRIIRIIK